MTSKVEEVARAIASANGDDGMFKAFLPHARAAIEAMREPTKQMLSGVRPQEYTIEHYHGSGHHRSFPTLGSGPVQVWQDMIDAALREEGR